MSEQQIQIFTSQDGQVELQVSLDTDTVWLSQRQVAELFAKDVRTVNEHIKNIYKEHELASDSTIRNFRIVQQEGLRQVNRDVDHYNLDVIISVGYRVKSQRGVQFRQWATRVLKQHLVEGYTLNQRRLQERGIEFEQAVGLLSRTLANQHLIDDQGRAVIHVIEDYARSWSLLQAYDEQSLSEIASRQSGMRALQLPAVLASVEELKAVLVRKGEATALFGQLRGNGLESAIATIEQGFGDVVFYPNVASRAAHAVFRHQESSAGRWQQTDRLISVPLVSAAQPAPAG